MSQITKEKHHNVSFPIMTYLQNQEIYVSPANLGAIQYLFFFNCTDLTAGFLSPPELSVHIFIWHFWKVKNVTLNTSSFKAVWWLSLQGGLVWKCQETTFFTSHRFGGRPFHKLSVNKMSLDCFFPPSQSTSIHKFEGENPCCSINNKH